MSAAVVVLKKELARRLQSRFPDLLLVDCEEVVGVVFSKMAEELAKGNRVELRGFGSFFLSRRGPRRFKNPRTGEERLLPGGWQVVFRPGKGLRRI